jgi:hypothetical protein
MNHDESWPWAELLPSDVEYADNFARLQHAFAEMVRLEPANNAPRDPKRALEFNIRGMRGEYAAFLYFRPCRWVHYVGFPDGRADIEGFINVKERRQISDDLIVMPQQLKLDHAYLMVFGHEHPLYAIGPWCWGHEIKGHRIEERQKDRPAYFIHPTERIMKPPNLLFDLVRERQRAALGFGEDITDVWYDSIGEIRPEARARGFK